MFDPSNYPGGQNVMILVLCLVIAAIGTALTSSFKGEPKMIGAASMFGVAVSAIAGFVVVWQFFLFAAGIFVWMFVCFWICNKMFDRKSEWDEDDDYRQQMDDLGM